MRWVADVSDVRRSGQNGVFWQGKRISSSRCSPRSVQLLPTPASWHLDLIVPRVSSVTAWRPQTPRFVAVRSGPASLHRLPHSRFVVVCFAQEANTRWLADRELEHAANHIV